MLSGLVSIRPATMTGGCGVQVVVPFLSVRHLAGLGAHGIPASWTGFCGMVVTLPALVVTVIGGGFQVLVMGEP